MTADEVDDARDHARFVDAPTTVAPTPAASPGAEAKLEPKHERHWYGYQTLIADGAGQVLALVALTTDNKGLESTLGPVPLTSYVLTPGIIHIAHRNIGKGIGDVGLRVGAPVVGALAGILIADGRLDDLDVGGAVMGILGASIGVGAAIAIDASVLAWEDDSPAPLATRAPAKSAVSVIPSIGPTKNGFAAGLHGTF